MTIALIIAGVIALVILTLIINATFRVNVKPNEVHVVQNRKTTTPYGKGFESNVYFNWWAWLPVVGVTRTIMPTSIFDITIEDYPAYDVGRVPFNIDVKAFFRVDSPALAAQRIENFDALQQQLIDILKSCIRSILAGADIEEILQGRSEFSDKFTLAVKEQLMKDWGVDVVKNIEFMEIRDASNSQVITNIQKKKESLINAQSRVEIAENNKNAELKEAEAFQLASIRQTEAKEAIAKREIEKDKTVAYEKEIALQIIKEQAKITKDKEMSVIQVETIRQAEIDKAQEIVDQEKQAQKDIIIADTNLVTSQRDAEAKIVKAKADAEQVNLSATARANEVKIIAEAEATGIQKKGLAEAETESAKQKATVADKIELMEKMKENKDYVQFMQTVEAINAQKDVGVAQAKALENADIKYLGTDKLNPSDGLSGILSTPGLANLGQAVSAFTETSGGSTLMDVVAKFTKMPKEKQDKIVKWIDDSEEKAE